MQPELKFQKELVRSARQRDCLSDIITHRFKKGWPEVLIKDVRFDALFIECKYEIERTTKDYVPIETTELQKICLTSMQDSGMIAFVLVCVEMDKKTKVCYPVYDIKQETLQWRNIEGYRPTGKDKKGLIWPIQPIIENAIKNLRKA